MNTIDAMRRSGELQSHHWKAATLLIDSLTDLRLHHQIAVKCREVEVSCECFGIDPFALVKIAVIYRKPLSDDPKVIGVLRETLNAIHRLRTRH